MKASEEYYCNESRRLLIRLIQAARSGADEELAPLVFYRGNDRQRTWTQLANPRLDDDRAFLGRLGRRIRNYMHQSTGYSLAAYYTETDRDGQWYVWEVHFNKGIDKKICYFRFREYDTVLALGDIDT